MERVLDGRTLNRTLLARQWLLHRVATPSVRDAVRHLVALQAQEAEPPYTALWARLAGFRREHLTSLMADRTLVRASGFRRTIQLMDAEDYLALYPLAQRGFDRDIRWLTGGDPAVLRRLRDALGDTAYGSFTDIKELLAPLVANLDPTLSRDDRGWYGLRMALALARVPRVGPESDGPRDRWVSAEAHLGRRLGEGDPEGLVRRYLAAYGPATIADLQWFTGTTRMREVFERMDLRTYAATGGAILYDNPDGALTDGGTPVRPRLIAAYDHAILGHADRTHIAERRHYRLVSGGQSVFSPAVLVDGRVAGIWRPRLEGGTATVPITLVHRVSDDDADALIEEAWSYASWRWPGADPDVSIEVHPGFD